MFFCIYEIWSSNLIFLISFEHNSSSFSFSFLRNSSTLASFSSFNFFNLLISSCNSSILVFIFFNSFSSDKSSFFGPISLILSFWFKFNSLFISSSFFSSLFELSFCNCFSSFLITLFSVFESSFPGFLLFSSFPFLIVIFPSVLFLVNVGFAFALKIFNFSWKLFCSLNLFLNLMSIVNDISLTILNVNFVKLSLTPISFKIILW